MQGLLLSAFLCLLACASCVVSRKEASFFMNQHEHHSKQHQPRQQQHQRQQAPGDVQRQRREYLWREHVRLELQVHKCLAQSGGLQREWQLLATRKAALQQRRSGLSTQILLSGLAGMRQLPAERLFHYERERIQQEEVRLQQAICSVNVT